MTKKTLSLLVLAALAMSACKNGASPGAAADPSRPEDAADVDGETARARSESGIPTPDADKPPGSYPELKSGEQIMFLYVAASRLPPDYAKLADAYSREYRNTSDSFRKNDLLQAIKPQLEKKIAEAAASPYAWMQANEGNVLGAYDFTRKGFPVNEFDHDGNRYFHDNSAYRLSWANRDQVRFAPVADEAVARQLESMRTQYDNPPQLKVYFFAQDANLNEQTVHAVVTRVQITDRAGKVIVEYGPDGGL